MRHTETPKQYQCRHIFTDGRRCSSPCLRQEEFCYYHHTTRKPVANPKQRRSRHSTFHLPLPEDRSAIQSSIGEVLQRIAANDIDPRRAGLLLYGLQIASLNLPKQQNTQRHTRPEPVETVEEITIDPTLGILAPRAEVSGITKRKSVITQLIESMLQNEEAATTREPTILPNLQATGESCILTGNFIKERPSIRLASRRCSKCIGLRNWRDRSAQSTLVRCPYCDSTLNRLVEGRPSIRKLISYSHHCRPRQICFSIMHMSFPPSLRLSVAALIFSAALYPQRSTAQQKNNVIIFVADGLRRGSVNAEDMPTFLKLRTTGVDFRNSHSVFPTFTTANASVIGTGHGLGDTGDYSNSIYPGAWLSRPDVTTAAGSITPFLENDQVLANMNSLFGGNYLRERTLLSVAREKGFNVASVGKLGPTAIQQNEAVSWDHYGVLSSNGAIIVDDSTGDPAGLPLPVEILDALQKANLPQDSPLRSNGFPDSSIWNNGFAGDAVTPGTITADTIQQQWFADVTTKVLLPKFAADKKPFVLLFWSRDPDGTQHNEGDSLQRLEPGINGDTSKRGLQNADRCLKQLLDWLDAHPAVKAHTDVLVTSDHGFATISRREIASNGTHTSEPSAALDYELSGKEKAEPKGTLPTGFLAVDLGIREHLRVFDPAVRATTGSSAYAELVLGGEKSQHSSGGSALLGETVKRVDGSDARLIVVANGGSDLLYVPGKNADVVRETIRTLAQLDYVGGIFVDDAFCPAASDCPGALSMSAIGLVGSSPVPRPAIVVTYKVFYKTPGDLQSAAQISDTTLQEGQGMHGGFGRDQTFNNMAATGPDFKSGFVDEAPMGNIDIAPTLAKILDIEMPSVGDLKGRVLQEALTSGTAAKAGEVKTLVSAPTQNGVRTVLEYQEAQGVRYYDRACLIAKDATQRCQ